MSRRTLFVANLSETTTARDLAWECERFGPLVRCDLPTPGGRAKGFAFVEFVDERDAIAAHNDLTHRRIDGRNLTVEFARRAPAPGWRHSPGPGMAPSHGAPPPYARRPPSPPYGKRGRRDERYSRSPSPARDRDERRSDRYRDVDRRDRHDSPPRGRDREREPRRDSRERDRDRDVREPRRDGDSRRDVAAPANGGRDAHHDDARPRDARSPSPRRAAHSPVRAAAETVPRSPSPRADRDDGEVQQRPRSQERKADDREGSRTPERELSPPL